MKKQTLPTLAYAYDALMPHIDAKTVELHHSKHHQTYVDGLNAALDKLTAARASGDFSAIKHLKREIAFHGSGHILHSLYWQSMTPNGSPLTAESSLGKAIIETFGSIETFLKEFTTACLVVEASGWGILGMVNGSLEIYTAEKHQNLTQWGVVPLLACDVWEHAYYLNYQNRRADYIAGFLAVADFGAANARHEAALGGQDSMATLVSNA